MSIATEYSRLVFKRSALSGIVPTIPTATTIDNTWVSTDLLVGEAFVNLADDRFWFRTDNGIVEVALSGNSMYRYTTGATLVGSTIFFDRTDLLSAYTVDLSSIVSSGGTSGNYLPLTVTGTTFVNVDNNALYFTGNSASSITTAVVGGSGNDDTFATVVTDDYAILAAQLNSGDDNYYIRTSANGASLESDTGTTVNKFIVTKSGMQASSTIPTFSGIEYAADYSANYTNRSLVDKEYVDGLAFSGSSASTQSLSDTLAIGNTTGPNDIIIDAGQLIKDATSNSTIEIGDGYGTLYSTGINPTSSNSQQDFIFLDPTLSNNGTGIQSFDTVTGGQGEFYVSPQSVNLQISDGLSDSVAIAMSPTSIIIESDNIKLPFVPSGTFTASLGLDSTGKIVTGATSGGGGSIWTSATYGSYAIRTLNNSTTDTSSGGGSKDYAIAAGYNILVEGDYSVGMGGADNYAGGEASGVFVGKNNTTENATLNTFIIGGSNNIVKDSATHSGIIGGDSHSFTPLNSISGTVIVGGSNIQASQSNTVYVPKLNIGTLQTGTSVNNLGIDANGNVIVGTTGTTTTTFPYDISFAISDETTQIVTGTSVMKILAARTINVTKVRASISSSATTTCEFDVLVGGTTILPQNLQINSGNTSTYLDVTGQTITADTFITVNIGAAGTGAKGAKIYILGTTTL